MCGKSPDVITTAPLETGRRASQINSIETLVSSAVAECFLTVRTVCICCIFYTGDFFRALWGPYAGWAQSVSLVLRFFLLLNSVCLPQSHSSSVSGFVLLRPEEVSKAERGFTSNAIM